MSPLERTGLPRWRRRSHGLLVGQFTGGLIARQFGAAAPFWFAFVGSGVTLVLVWRQLGHIAHADEAHAGQSG